MPSPVRELVGVYAADGTVWGELSYWVGARLGRAHCALCDITHGTFREKDEWRSCRADLAVPFQAVHRDEMPADVASAVGELPAVVGRTDDGVILVLGPAALAACDGDPLALVGAIEGALAGTP
jgi:hypothetical protein